MKLLRQCCLLAVFLLVAGLGSARAQSFAWAKVVRGAVDTAFVRSQGSATDAAGSTYVAVQFSDSIRFGQLLLTGPQVGSAAVIKYDPAGAVVWAKALYNVSISQLAADNSPGSGGVFVTGFSRSGATWDGAPFNNPSNDTFYARFTASGTLQWTQPLATGSLSSYSHSLGLVTDDAGGAYFSGTLLSSGTVAGTSVDLGQAFILKVDGTGATQWVRVLHGQATQPLYDFRLGPKPGGGCLVSVYCANTLYLGAGTATPLLTGTSAYAFSLSNFDAAGTPLWSRFIGTSPSSQSTLTVAASAADASGNCYATGRGNGNIGTTSVNGFFLAKYDAAGSLQWAQNSTVSPGTEGTLLAVNSAGATAVVRTSLANGQAAPVLGNLRLQAPFNFVHYNALGQAQWTVADAWGGRTPGTLFPYFIPAGLGMDAAGNLYPVGQPTYSQGIRAIQLGAQTAVIEVRWSDKSGQNRVLTFECHERQPSTTQTPAL